MSLNFFRPVCNHVSSFDSTRWNHPTEVAEASSGQTAYQWFRKLERQGKCKRFLVVALCRSHRKHAIEAAGRWAYKLCYESSSLLKSCIVSELSHQAAPVDVSPECPQSARIDNMCFGIF